MSPDPALAFMQSARAVVLVACCCVPWIAAGWGARAAASEGGRPNVVLISIDSLRADHLGSYGYPRATSPSIDRLASEGVLFEVAVSSTSWTLPAHASLFTGLPDSIHGCTRNTTSLALERRTLAEALREAGYRTAGFWSAPYLDPHFGMGQGFDDYVSCTGYDIAEDAPRGMEGEKAREWIGRVNKLSHTDVTSPRIVKKVTKWLDSHMERERPFFLFIHMWDVHYDYLAPSPYDTMFDPDYTGKIDGRKRSTPKRHRPPERDLEHLIALYDGEIAWTDHHVGALLDLLDERNLAERTIVVLTADHGEEFYEHGRFGHHSTLFEESIRIPLIVRQRGRLPAGSRIPELVRMLDIAPTILDLAGVKGLPDIMGRSLVPLLRPDGAAPRGIALSELVRPNANRTLTSIRSSAWKFVSRRKGQESIGLWDLRRDPSEERNLYGVDAALTAEARRTLNDTLEQLDRLRERHRLETPPGPREIPEDLERQLEALGYLKEEPDD
jgi:arylsulfatase A-like enzyme